jgi:hypothetical protein
MPEQGCWFQKAERQRMKKISIVLGALTVCTSTLMALPMGSMMSGQTNFTNGNLIGSVDYAVFVPLAAPIPEPATLTLLALGSAFAIRSRRS